MKVIFMTKKEKSKENSYLDDIIFFSVLLKNSFLGRFINIKKINVLVGGYFNG